MHLHRIQIPGFRVLRDVDITFEKEFSPRIFPLGSQNGGGKSTLLQLIFVLLHCSMNFGRLPYLTNLLETSNIDKNVNKKLLAKVDIWDDDKIVEINFIFHGDLHLNRILEQGENSDRVKYSFSASGKLKRIQNKKRIFEKRKTRLEEPKKRLGDIKKLGGKLERVTELEKFYDNEISGNAYLRKRIDYTHGVTSIEEIEIEIDQLMEELKNRIEKSKNDLASLLFVTKKVSEYLQSENMLLITPFSTRTDEEEVALLCRIPNLSIEDAESFLKKLSDKIFLAAPSTQVFLFLSQEDRNLLFKRKDADELESYDIQLTEAKSDMPGLFTYDFFDVELLVKSFLSARDKDFREAIENGEYGKSYSELLADLNSMLVDKKLNLRPDLSGVMFKMDGEDEDTVLYPEDLSHGELKRLGIYMWLRYHDIDDAIVLMDEIEIALHPDWQYQIVDDLMQWAPNSQYILATHSYELCQAVTPAHVKELEPRLIKKASD